MAARRIFVASTIFILYLYLYAIIDSTEISTILTSTGGDVMKYPSRNSGDLPRRSRNPSISTALKLKVSFTFTLTCFFLMYYIKKVFYSIITRLGYVFRLYFPHRLMNLKNVKSNRKISCKNSTAQA